jgi:hypothetical protein
MGLAESPVVHVAGILASAATLAIESGDAWSSALAPALTLALSKKLVIGTAFLVAMIFAAAATRRPSAVFLCGWIFLLTYNRAYYSFEPLVGAHGFQGPYWIPADAFFVLMLLAWAWEAAFGKRLLQNGPPILRWYFPFAAACLFSALVAVRPEWAAFEMIRVVKVGIVLAYARSSLDAVTWWACLGGFGAAVAAQSLFSIMEVVFNVHGVLYLFGIGEKIDFQLDIDDQYRWSRAIGTMNHPPRLSAYLLLTVPAFAAVSLTHPKRVPAIVFGVLTMLGLVCQGLTQTRFAWLLAALQIGFLPLGLAWFGLMPARRAIGLLWVGAMLGALAVVPVTGKLIERFSSDFGRSVDERVEGTIAALKMYDDHNPLLGVGLNNYKAHMLDYQPEARWTLEYEDQAVHVLHVRFPVGPWNGFVMTLVETGIIGLAALMVYIARAHLLGFKAVATTRNPAHVRAASLGLLLGLAGVAAHQFTDHSFWEDPILYSFTLVVALVNSASIGLGSASAGAAATAPSAAPGDVADLPPKGNA